MTASQAIRSTARECVSKGEGELSNATLNSGRTTLKQTAFSGMVSQSEAMRRVFTLIERVAKTDITVLILGESGTGKELVASALHKLSGRKGRLVPVNCAAIPEDILESELFGHEKGAFTGAVNNRMGRFQLADNGTIFLDEIGEMSPKLQAKLLRVLQTKVVEPVGSTRSTSIDVRVIAATNKDLRAEVDAGRFREDLYYRLQVVPVELPALRERGDDVRVLLNFFLTRFRSKFDMHQVDIAPEALKQLLNYNWPGNVRELENLVERLVLLSDGSSITANSLPRYIRESQVRAQQSQLVPTVTEIVSLEQGMPLQSIPTQGLDFNQLIDQYETDLILKALNQTAWNKKAAARLLGLNRTTLVEKIKKKNLELFRSGAEECEELSDSESERSVDLETEYFQ